MNIHRKGRYGRKGKSEEKILKPTAEAQEAQRKTQEKTGNSSKAVSTWFYLIVQ